MPPIYDVRAEFQGSYKQTRAATNYIVVHHAAALYPTAAGIDDVRAIARYHTNTQGWPGIAYSEVIAEEVQGGRLACYITSAPETLRYHVAHRNHEAVGLCCATNFGDRTPSDAWLEALAERLRVWQQRYPSAKIVGHQDIALGPQQAPDGRDWRTSCPGTNWPRWKMALFHLLNHPAADPWHAWGTAFPLQGHERAWAVAQAWLPRRHQLGAATSLHTYPDKRTVYVTFQHGIIVQAPGKAPLVEVYS